MRVYGMNVLKELDTKRLKSIYIKKRSMQVLQWKQN